MAQADFDFVNSTVGYVAPSGGTDGTTITHSSLASPLTGNGLYGRQYVYGTSTSATIIGVLAASVDSGAWVGTPNTHAVSVRATVRLDGADLAESGSAGRCMGVGVKIGNVGANGSYPMGPSGYVLIVGRIYVGAGNETTTGTSLALVLSSESSDIGNREEVIITASMGADEWHRVRMDVIPVGTSQDIIKVYTGTGAVGSEVWTLEHTETVLSTDQHYCDWGHGSSNRIGYINHCHGSSQVNDEAYIDAFVAMREAV